MTACILFSFCIIEDCRDIFHHPLSETEYNWFLYKENDTLFFLENKSKKIHYLACTKSQFKNTSIHWKDEKCNRGGYNEYYEILFMEFTSNLPHFENEILELNLFLRTKGDSLSNLVIDFLSKSHFGYKYALEFNYPLESIRQQFNGGPTATVFDTLLINGHQYQNCHLIHSNSKNNSSLFYDTVLYNAEGFLLFSSSVTHQCFERFFPDADSSSVLDELTVPEKNFSPSDTYTF
jgi:hypothetical protein